MNLSDSLLPAPPRRRRIVPLLLRDPDARAVEIGVAATIIIHLLFLLLAPHWLQVGSAHPSAARLARPKQFTVRMVPPPPPPKPPPLPQRFVEANPNAPSNVPDKTRNFSFMNQQAAQPKPTPNRHSDTPATQGRKDVDSNQIVTGSLSKPEPVAPPASVTPPAKPAATARREENPLPGFEKDIGSNPTGFGTNVAKPAENSTNVPNQVKGLQQAPPDENAASALPQIDPKHPMPRPSLSQHVRPAIIRENPFGTDNVGPIAFDARWSSYGEYLHEMCEIIQAELDKIMDNSRTYPPEGSTVTVKFILKSDGTIGEILDHHGTSNEQGTEVSIASITNPAPFRKWTEDMVTVLGNQQELTFTFYFE